MAASRIAPLAQAALRGPLAAAAWAVSLTLAEGTSGFTRGPRDHTEYGADVAAVRADPREFLRTFADEIERYEIHVRGHPPGMVLSLAGVDAIGLDIYRAEAAMALVAAASSMAALLYIVKQVAGEPAARAAAPFLVLTPAAIWMVTSADALYAALAVWGTAACTAATAATGRRRAILAALGGAVFGLGLLGTYGLALAVVAPVSIAAARRAWSVLIIAAGAGAAVLLSLVPLGFWYLDGLLATIDEYNTLDIDRPWWYFAFANVAAWSLALGPAVIAGLLHLRDRRVWLVVGAGLAAAGLAHLSMLSKGEVERIWLPFTLLVLPAAGALVDRRRAWLGAQVVLSCGIVWTVTTKW